MLRKVRLALALSFLAAVGAGAWIKWPGKKDAGYFPERSSRSPLKSLASAQADFRENDRDANGMRDFWRKDVRGLYGVPGSDGRAIRLIEVSTAGADARPASKYAGEVNDAPTGGYWYRAIRHAGEVEPDPNRFAFCAYPETYLAGKNTFVIDEGNTLFKKDLGHGRGIEVFPADLLKEGWARLD